MFSWFRFCRSGWSPPHGVQLYLPKPYGVCEDAYQTTPDVEGFSNWVIKTLTDETLIGSHIIHVTLVDLTL